MLILGTGLQRTDAAGENWSRETYCTTVDRSTFTTANKHNHQFNWITEYTSNKKYVLSNSESVQYNFFIFDHVTFTSSKTAAVYKISWKSHDFSLRYGDLSIFKMAAVRHLGIVLPPYETIHEVSVAGRISLSNFMSIWYTDLKIQLFEFFAYLAWNAYSGTQNGGFRALWTPKCDYSSSSPQKGTHLRKFASVKLSTIKIHWGVWPVGLGELTESVTDTQTDTHTLRHTHR